MTRALRIAAVLVMALGFGSVLVDQHAAGGGRAAAEVLLAAFPRLYLVTGLACLLLAVAWLAAPMEAGGFGDGEIGGAPAVYVEGDLLHVHVATEGLANRMLLVRFILVQAAIALRTGSWHLTAEKTRED